MAPYVVPPFPDDAFAAENHSGLAAPRQIFPSVARLSVASLLVACLLLPTLYAARRLWRTGSEDWIGWGFCLLVLIVALRGLWRALPKWLSLEEPHITISREGLEFRGRRLIPWAAIEENIWLENRILGHDLRARILLVVKEGEQDRLLKADALGLNVDRAEYQRLCALYSGRSPPAPGPEARAA